MNDSDEMENKILANCPTGLMGEQSVCVLPDNVKKELVKNPTVRVFIDGLSVLYFSPEHTRTEIGFLEPDHLPIQMKIYKEGDCNPIWSTENPLQFPPGATGKCMITINSTRTSEMGFRYELDLRDDKDFRHMPNLAKWHGQECLDVLNNAKDALSARLNIHGATFYTLKKSEGHAVRKPPVGIDENLFNIGRILGGDISYPAGENLEIEIKLRSGGTPVRVSLPNDGASKYIITVRNIARTHNDHFQHLYKVFDKNDRFGMRFVPKEKHWDYCGDKGIFESVADSEMNGHPGAEHHHDKNAGAEGVVTEFACQLFVGGCGNLPDVP